MWVTGLPVSWRALAHRLGSNRQRAWLCIPPSYNTVARVSPREMLLTKHSLSMLSCLLGRSDICDSYDHKAHENYCRAWRRKRDTGSLHNIWREKALSRLQVSRYFHMLSGTVWWHLEDHGVVNRLLFVSLWLLCCTFLKAPQIALRYLWLLYSLNSGSVPRSLCTATQQA